jgi:hypothetical protein
MIFCSLILINEFQKKVNARDARPLVFQRCVLGEVIRSDFGDALG